jgi:putative membrane protein
MTKSPRRRPAAFRLDDPQVVLTPPSDRDSAPRRRIQPTVIVHPEPDALTGSALPVSLRRRRRRSWMTLFWPAAGALVLLGLGLAVTRLIEDLYARTEWLGMLAAAIAAVAALALAGGIVHEAAGLVRLRAVERLRGRAQAAVAADDRNSARAIVRDLVGLTRGEPRLARARSDMTLHIGEIIDGGDLLRITERELMAPLDAEARALVAAAAKRVSIVTAVSPRAAVDMLFVLFTAVGLVRRLAELYGGRPGTLGLMRLMRRVIAHLAVTGGMASGDSLLQQMLGHGVAAKVSARLGEGVLNGLLTARLGLAAIEVVRPLRFEALPAPALGDLAAGLLRRAEIEEATAPAPTRDERGG